MTNFEMNVKTKGQKESKKKEINPKRNSTRSFLHSLFFFLFFVNADAFFKELSFEKILIFGFWCSIVEFFERMNEPTNGPMNGPKNGPINGPKNESNESVSLKPSVVNIEAKENSIVKTSEPIQGVLSAEKKVELSDSMNPVCLSVCLSVKLF